MVRWSSLSLRLSAAFIAVLVTAAFAVGYLFDRGRAEALEKREIEHLRLHAERGADEVGRVIRQLRGDVLFLANTPPIQGIRRALETHDFDRVGGSTLMQWEERLQQIFISFAQIRPEYFQLRLLGIRDNGRELVRVERTRDGVRITPSEALQRKGDRYYFREASRTKPGSVYFSNIDLDREHAEIGIPHLPTLRAATPVHDPSGNLFGVVVVNMDMGWAFERAASFRDAQESVYVANERGDFLLHPVPGRAFAFEFGTPFRLTDAFPGHDEEISNALSKGNGFFELPASEGELVAYLTARAWDPKDPNRRLVVILTEPIDQVFPTRGLMRRDSLLGMGGLLVLAILLVLVMVRRLTRSLTALASASAAIAEGHYQVALPAAQRGEIGSLVRSFRHMVGEVARRQDALAELNRELERRVEERTAELRHQHALQNLILENIADGVVVTDRDGHFLLWNRKAEQIVGAGPEEVEPERWSTHFGVFRDELGEPVPAEELPLVRAIRGEASDNVEIFLCNPRSKAPRWAQVTARPLRAPNGSIVGAVAVLVDVTEHKRLRQHIEAHRTELTKVGLLALGAGIASSAAHKLSQPIAAISNYAGAAVRLQKQRQLGENELFDILTRIEALASEAGETLDRLRALIRHRNQVPIPIDVNQVADSSLDFVGDRIKRQGVAIERHYGQDLPNVIGDPIELGQVLIQLISNALEAMDSTLISERRLCIGSHYDPIANMVRIEIADTGPGVSPELVNHLFEPWQTDKPNSLGIGLSIAQMIVERRGGGIRMKTRKAGGALFQVEMPAARGKEP